MGAGAGYAGSRAQAQMNLKISREKQDFQERMSSTAFQRQMEDMRIAGLNPLLAKNMGGATTPPGAAIPAPDISGAIHAGASTAKSLSERMLVKQQTKKAWKEGQRLHAETELLNSKAVTEVWNAESAKHQSYLLKAQRPAASAQQRFDKTKGGEILRNIKRVKDAFNPFNPKAGSR